ncbi:conserved hypothetical protein [Burkholderiales bacterium 8X]|nr:conserved hypothetical protein [Burkholderiales bacterium 8X]
MPRLKPLVDIQRLASDTYAYSVGARGSEAAADTDGGAFETLAMCIFDAGASLGQYFAEVELQFEGMLLGSLTTDALRREPHALAARIQAAC